MEKLEQLENKIDKDYNDYKNKLITENSADTIFERKCYDIAIIQNFYDGITEYIEDFNNNNEMEENIDNFTLNEDIVDKIINYKDNILIELLDGWKNWRHPERYDFWYSYYNDLPEIIEEIVDYIYKENKYDC